VAKVRDNYIKKQLEAVRASEKILLVDREQGIAPIATPEGANIHPGAKRPIKIGYPDDQQDYSSACQERVFYGLIPVKESDIESYKDKLVKLEEVGLYGSYQRSLNTVLDYTTPREGRMMDRIAKFTDKYIFSSDPLSDNSLILPKNIKDVLSGEIVREIWVEGFWRGAGGVAAHRNSCSARFAHANQRGICRYWNADEVCHRHRGRSPHSDLCSTFAATKEDLERGR
jgi:hypothetical protein